MGIERDDLAMVTLAIAMRAELARWQPLQAPLYWRADRLPVKVGVANLQP